MKLNLGLLLLTGSMALVACGANRNGSTQKQVAGEPCSVEGQQSECAKDGYPYACGPCQGHWLLCQGGKWIPIHCDPPPPVDTAIDTRPASDVPFDLAIIDSRSDASTAAIDGADGSPDGSTWP
jgi:hypothetical protein